MTKTRFDASSWRRIMRSTTYDPSFTFPELTSVTICWSPKLVAQSHIAQAWGKCTSRWSPRWNRSAASSILTRLNTTRSFQQSFPITGGSSVRSSNGTPASADDKDTLSFGMRSSLAGPAVLAIAGRIESLNELQLNAGNHRVDYLLSEFQSLLAMILVATLLLGSGMAAFSAWKILGLEARAHAQYQEVVGARKQLAELSARLVQAQENERRKVSRELHDEVGQALSAVLVELRNWSTDSGTQADAQSRGHVETVRELVENAVRVVRNMALLLRPSMLDDLGLVPALRWQAREVSKQTSMDVSVAAELVSDDLPDEYKTCIYRVVQEALHNCSRHARATRVDIRVQQEPGRLSLFIQDDGQGFDAKQTKGLGLLGMEERVNRLAGKYQIHSVPGSGTIVTIELPFSSNGKEPATRGHEKDPNPVSG